jgi:hypothetical protein
MRSGGDPARLTRVTMFKQPPRVITMVKILWIVSKAVRRASFQEPSIVLTRRMDADYYRKRFTYEVENDCYHCPKNASHT